MSSNEPNVVIACNPRAIDATSRDSHVAVSKSIFAPETILEVKELANGYGFRLPLETPMLYKVVEFISNERLCCPFFTFSLVVGEQLWLELTGAPDVKALIQSDILAILQTGTFPTPEDLQATYDASTAN